MNQRRAQARRPHKMTAVKTMLSMIERGKNGAAVVSEMVLASQYLDAVRKSRVKGMTATVDDARVFMFYYNNGKYPRDYPFMNTLFDALADRFPLFGGYQERRYMQAKKDTLVEFAVPSGTKIYKPSENSVVSDITKAFMDRVAIVSKTEHMEKPSGEWLVYGLLATVVVMVAVYWYRTHGKV